MNSIKEQLHNHIGTNRVDKAIGLLKQKFKTDSVLYNQVILFESQIHHAKNSYNGNQISLQDYTEQIAKAKQGLLDLCGCVEDDSPSPVALSNWFFNRKTILPIALAVTAVSIVFFTNLYFSKTIESSANTQDIMKITKQEMKKVKTQLDAYLLILEKGKINKELANDPAYLDSYYQLVNTLQLSKTPISYADKYIPCIDNIDDFVTQVEMLHKSCQKGQYGSFDAKKKSIIENFRNLNSNIDNIK
jgi:hypothetical protein